MTPECPPRSLSQDEIEAYRRDGAVCVRGLYSRSWVEKLTAALDEIIAQPTFDIPGVSRMFRVDGYSWLVNDAIRDFILKGPSAHILQQAFGSSSVNFFHDAIFAKQALTPDPTPWHHDSTFWPFAGDQIGSLWTSVDAVDVESSALEFIRGSHLWGRRFKPVAVGGTVMTSEQMEALPDIEGERGKYDILSWDLEPGDAILFHACAVHGARGNKSPNRKRRAIATRWFGDDVVYRPTGQPALAWPHGLNPGDRPSGQLFPQILPQWDELALCERLNGPVYPDPELMAQVFKDLASAERVPVRM